MKKIVLVYVLLLLSVVTTSAQGMNDQQVMSFIAAEMKAGTGKAQIVTKLMQRGVKIDQIRRLTNQYGSQMSKSGATVADGTVNMATARMAENANGF